MKNLDEYSDQIVDCFVVGIAVILMIALCTTQCSAQMYYKAGSCSVGAPCDDGDPNTYNDVFDSNCNCEGEIDRIRYYLSSSVNDYDLASSTDHVNITLSEAINLDAWHIQLGFDGDYSDLTEDINANGNRTYFFEDYRAPSFGNDLYVIAYCFDPQSVADVQYRLKYGPSNVDIDNTTYPLVDRVSGAATCYCIKNPTNRVPQGDYFALYVPTGGELGNRANASYSTKYSTGDGTTATTNINGYEFGLTLYLAQIKQWPD